MVKGYFRDDRGRMWEAERGDRGAWLRPVVGAGLQAPRGLGLAALGDDGGKVYFTWRAPSKISLGSFLTDGWNAAQARLGNKLAERGVLITRIGSEAISYFPQLRYALIVNGHAPAGIDGFENIIADLADAEGFRVDRGGIEMRTGGTPKPGDGGGGDDDDEGDFPGWLVPAFAGVLVLALVMRR